MDRVEKRTRKKISLWTFLKFVDTFHVTSTYIYIYIYTCTFTAVHYCLSISKAWLSPHDSIRNSELRNECALPHSRPHPRGEGFYNRTRMNLPAIRYSILDRTAAYQQQSSIEERKQGAKDEKKEKRNRERERFAAALVAFGQLVWARYSPIYFNLAFRWLTAAFQRSRKNGSRQKVFKSRPKTWIPGCT